MRKIIALLLICVLSIQMLPTWQMGLLLSSNQINEEIPHSVTIEKKGHSGDTLKSDSFVEALSPFESFIATGYFHFNASILSLYEGDIQTPPPNVFC